MQRSSTCFVPGCITGSKIYRKRCKLEGEKSKSLFRPPRDPDLFEKWKRIIPALDKELTRESLVCELHFSEDDIERYFTTKLFDGSINRIKRGRNTLKVGAVPCKFPDLPDCLSKCTSKEKLPIIHYFDKQRTVKTVKIQKSDLNIFESKRTAKETEKDVDEDMNITEQSFCVENLQDNMNIELSTAFNDFNFEYLIENYNIIKMPNQWWNVVSTEEFVIFAKWTTDYVDDRRVVIQQDLNVKVFLKDTEIDVPNKEIKCLNDISILLQEVENIILCAGIPQVSPKKCLLYLPERKSKTGQYSRFCEECRKVNHQLAKSARRKPNCNRQVSRYKTLYQRFVCEHKKNMHLQEKVAELHLKVAAIKKKYAAAKSDCNRGHISTRVCPSPQKCRKSSERSTNIGCNASVTKPQDLHDIIIYPPGFIDLDLIPSDENQSER